MKVAKTLVLMSVSLFWSWSAPSVGAEVATTFDMDFAKKHIDAAARYARKEDYYSAKKKLVALIASDTFPRLDETVRSQVFSRTAFVFIRARDLKNAHAYLKLATAMSTSSYGDWVLRWDTEVALDDTEHAAETIIQIASKWPKEVRKLSPRHVNEFMRKLKSDPAMKAHYFQVLEALSRTEWPEVRFAADWHWQVLAQHQLDQGRTDAAFATAKRIGNPKTLIAMRASKKFAPILEMDPEKFDIDRAVAANVAYMRTLVSDNPTSLENLNYLVGSLLEAKQGDEALELTSRAIEAHAKNAKAFTDVEGNMNWTLEFHAHALTALRRDGAVEVMKKAAALSEAGRRNVSQTINLSFLYCRQGNATEARKTANKFSKSDKSVTPYGRMGIEAVLLCADVIEGNTASVDRRLKSLHAQRDIAAETYRNALLRANRMDEAAAWVIELLADPERQDQALFDLQSFSWGNAGLPMADAVDDRVRELVKRPDVRDAIEVVGNVRHYDIDPIY